MEGGDINSERARPLLLPSEDSDEDSFQRTRLTPVGAELPPSPNGTSAGLRNSTSDSQQPYSQLGDLEDAQNTTGEPSPDAWWHTYKYSYAALTFLGFVDAVEYGVVMPSLFTYLLRLDDGTRSDRDINYQYGLIIAIFSLASLASKPLIGYLADKRPYKETIIWSTMIAIIGNLLYFSADYFVNMFGDHRHAFVYLLTARILAGVGCANTSLVFSFVARTVPGERRTKYMTILSMGKIFGFLLGPGLNLITAHMKFTFGNFHVDEYNAPGLFVALVLLALIALLFGVLEEPPSYDINAVGRSESEIAQLGSVWHLYRLMSLPVLLSFLNIFYYNFLIGCVESFVVPLATIAFQWSTIQTSYIFLAITASVLVNSFLVIGCSGRIEDRTFLLVSSLLAIAGPSAVHFLFYYDMPVWQFWCGTVLWALPISLAIPSNRALFTRLVEESHLQGFLSSGLSVFASLGGAAGPAFVGFTLGERPTEPEHIRVAPMTVLGVFIGGTFIFVANVLVLYVLPSKEPILRAEVRPTTNYTSDMDEDASEEQALQQA
mmetsp:Transcript_7088/g.14249  ORF Transcript_7088/g.14249 Transcript_7088/m.14249 type:complete len:548 (-) Transcript_7088:74-1717(-)